MLGERMPQFKNEGDHVKEHEAIHEGLVEFAGYVRKVTRGEKWDGEKLRGIMDGFRGVLFAHMDHEVESLKAGELKKVVPVPGEG
jgi:hypothetical protein